MHIKWMWKIGYYHFPNHNLILMCLRFNKNDDNNMFRKRKNGAYNLDIFFLFDEESTKHKNFLFCYYSFIINGTLFLVNFWLLQLLCAKEEQDFVSELILKISDILPGSNIVNLEEENHGNSKIMKIKHSLVLDLC